MPEPALDRLSDVSEGLKAIAILSEDWGTDRFPAYGVGVLIRILGREVEDVARSMPEQPM